MPKTPRQNISERRYVEHNVYDKRVVLKQHRSKMEIIDLLKDVLSEKSAGQMHHGYIFLIRRLLDNLFQVTEMDTLQRIQLLKLLHLSSEQDVLDVLPILAATVSLEDELDCWYRYQSMDSRYLLETSEPFLRSFVNHLDFDEDRNVRGSLGHVLLSTLVRTDQATMLRFLLERGVNTEPDGRYEDLPFSVACQIGNGDIVHLFMYYNVSPYSQCRTRSGSAIYTYHIIAAILNDEPYVAEMMLDYSFDRSTGCPFDILIILLMKKSKFFERMINFCYDNCVHGEWLISSDYLIRFWEHINQLPDLYLMEMMLITLIDFDMIDVLLEYFTVEHWLSYWAVTFNNAGNAISLLQVLELLATYYYRGETVLQLMLNKVHNVFNPLRVVMRFCTRFDLHPEIVLEVALLLLTNNVLMDSYVLSFMYEYEDYELFQICCWMGVDPVRPPNIFFLFDEDSSDVPGFFYQFPKIKMITDVLNDPEHIIPYHDIQFYLQLTSHSAVKRAAYRSHLEMLHFLADSLPAVPTLFELARDATRKHVANAYKVQNNLQFFLAVNNLETCGILKKAILYQRPLVPLRVLVDALRSKFGLEFKIRYPLRELIVFDDSEYPGDSDSDDPE